MFAHDLADGQLHGSLKRVNDGRLIRLNGHGNRSGLTIRIGTSGRIADSRCDLARVFVRQWSSSGLRLDRRMAEEASQH